MKNTIELTIITCIVAFLAACAGNSGEYVLTGKIENCTSSYGIIGLAERGLGDTVHIAGDGTFTYRKQLDKPQTSFLVLMDQQFFAQLLMINGTTTHLTADPVTCKLQFDGDLKEAYAFYERTQQSLNTKDDPAVYASFGTLCGTLTAFRDSVAREVKTLPNRDFQTLQLREVDDMIEAYCIRYFDYLQANGQAPDSDPEYNRYMESLDLNNPDYLHDRYTGYYFNWKRKCLPAGEKDVWLRTLQIVPQKITDPKVRDGAVMSILVDYFNEGADLRIDEVCTAATAIVQDSSGRAWIARNGNALKKAVPGAEAPDCEWTDAEGNVSRFSDLRGKVVYLDVWATWCGPCCEEIPYMEKLAARFRNDPRIEIVSISVDSHRKDWLEKLREDKPEWKQFLYKDFCDLYGIAGIPRFILIDAAGKIITANAPRPSDPEIISWLDEKLK